MRAIQFDRNMRGEPTLLQRFRRELGVGCCREKIPAQSEEHADPAFVHLFDRLNGIDAVLARRIESEFRAELVEELVVHAFPDAHRPVALNIRMPAHRTRSRTATTDVSAEKKEIHDLLNG